ncbi:MAG: hypothetical protein COZ06_21885 [Armatimonadetes bacterium CG_4_10_14_3_um_filter_66_18]|nr:hypothetical protein [Armatimonadota bacterium]OIO92553.1 MAG: hypothetical protein AUJ96_32075 [Armatimonadetes bacterium CG2_30_66_41]PIU91535.1 MAG: hypothetical protein COS65_21715 [Armatimonadetes bacterium CG06_land_8_20_14_3_00_66_21]PIX48545.1 MAG: hypothetical protein COZ57_05295 [Armatimonadetes bacterium CG_4_8_14_3_um_filter_66_20]PIY43862.1 MAG: hypothetical protein COZ06_21885 [Armatimonadetes bacterium CG_4_10_14_3_um_filter_66_18]PIZ36955.1 MAG: hypothetical protein COY42_24
MFRVSSFVFGICGLAALGVCARATAAPLRLYVAPNGNDAWSGKLAGAKGADGPFASLTRARDEIRKLKKEGGLPADGAVVELAAGVYELAAPVQFTAEDSGTETAPVVYRAKSGAEVRLVGGKRVTNFAPVTDAVVLQRLDEAARGKVLQADLKALGVTDFGDPVADGKRLELFFQDRPMKVSRWPNEGFAKIVDVVGGAPHKIHGIPGDKIGKFTYDAAPGAAGDHPARWVGEKDPWVHGYWFWDWADERQRIESIDTESHTLAVKPPYHGYGYRQGAWWCAFNMLSELDMPEEYYLDRETGILYFWPPAPVEQGNPTASVIPELIHAEGMTHVAFRGFVLEATRSTPVVIGNANRVQVVACTIRNTGGSAVSMSGTDSGVVGCDIYETANGGVSLNGGDRNTLTPAKLYVDNNHIHDYARWRRVYQPGISLYGVGNLARHNLIHDAPHMALGFGGNDHVIEYNEIHSVCYESNDAGAIYTGRNWTMRGTVLRHNYLHHINGREGRGCVGMYLDDQFSGTTMYGNLFSQVTRAAMIGGGRDCTIENNVFVDCVPATHVDARGLGWAASGFGGLKASLAQTPYKQEPWASRYPQLVSILDDDPMAPKGNVIARNICVGGRWGDFEAKAKPLVTFTDNFLEGDPGFVDAAQGDFRLRDDSPALKLGFKPIPLKEIGLVNDGNRASWPVLHEVRPMLAPPPAVARAQRATPVVLKVARRAAGVQVDGVLAPQEWTGADPAKAMPVEQGIQGEKVTPQSQAWLSWDDQRLYVAIDNAVNPKFPVRPGNTWGQDDAVELAIRNPAAGKDAPILVLRGFPSRHFESTDEAGASQAATRKAAEGVQYAAKIVDGKHWVAEWSVPFASLGIDPAKHTKLQFNLSVRKSADEQWLMWQGTGACTWEVGNAGVIELVR